MVPVERVLLWTQTFIGDARSWGEQKPISSFTVLNREGLTLLEPPTVPGFS